MSISKRGDATLGTIILSMTCFFCGKKASVDRSPFDKVGEPPDIWRATCDTTGCVLRYDFEGSLKSLDLNYGNLKQVKTELQKCNEQGTPKVMRWYKGQVILWPPS